MRKNEFPKWPREKQQKDKCKILACKKCKSFMKAFKGILYINSTKEQKKNITVAALFTVHLKVKLAS